MVQKNIPAVTSRLESASSTDYEDPLRDYETEDLNLSIHFEHFVLSHSEDSVFEDYLSTSYFLK